MEGQMDEEAAVVPQISEQPPPSRSVSRIWANLINRQEFLVLVLLLAVVAFLSLRTDTFLSAKNLSSVSRNFSWIAIVALGQSMVIIIGGIDLSVGATLALAGLVAARCMQVGLPVPVAIAAGLLVGVIMGWANGFMVARVRLPPFIVTLGTMSIAR
jgi:ribose transport system permease protein